MKSHDICSRGVFLIFFGCLIGFVFVAHNVVGKAKVKSYQLHKNEGFSRKIRDHKHTKKLLKKHGVQKSYSNHRLLKNCIRPLKNRLKPVCHTADKTDKVLSIKDETKFVDKVIELMQADDSDVLKNINEDEQPFFIQPRSRSPELQFDKHRLNSFKRSNLHFLAFNSTLPDVTTGSARIPFEALLTPSASVSPKASTPNQHTSVHSYGTQSPSHDTSTPHQDTEASSYNPTASSSDTSTSRVASAPSSRVSTPYQEDSISSNDATSTSGDASVPHHFTLVPYDTSTPSHDTSAPFHDASASLQNNSALSQYAPPTSQYAPATSYEASANSSTTMSPSNDAAASLSDASNPFQNASVYSSGILTPHATATPILGARELKASRVCKPGPPLASNKRLPNCLIIGDSIALSYSYSVAAALQGRCIVQLAPFSSMGVALDSSYGLQCLPLLLSTSNLTPTRFDAIIFNFGLHDINYSGMFPEESSDIKKYVRNLGRLKKKFLKTGAGVSFVLTTPVPFDVEMNKMVIKYNSAAKRVMLKSPSVDTIDLYKYVIEKCGQIPFDNCFMMKRSKDVHYSVAGSILLGKQIAAKFVEILKDENLYVERGFSIPENANLSLPLFKNLKKDAIKCSQNVTVPTRCPSSMTCVPNEVSRTRFGCCPLKRGVDCGDNWHCCPEKTSCHKDCNFESCKCLML